MADPSFERCPDFTGEAYRAIRDALAQAVNENDQQVTERLTAAWDADHTLWVEAWNQQQLVKAQIQAEAERMQLEQEAEAHQLAEEEAERECKEAEKKKPKMNDFDETSSVPSVIVQRPSQHALQKLSTFDFIDLWYFSPAGCTEATRNNRANADDTFSISKVDEILTLRSIASVKASRNAIEDHKLTFEVFLQAKNNFLFYAKSALWPSKHLDTLTEFFWNIETHPMRAKPNGNTIVLTYASRVRYNWHDDLKANRAFNISIINEELMKNIGWEVNARIGEERT
ncbi:hypothetical protein PAXRUDRAFT_22020 [Paxillus rubicundulus Ve08.2h10]|uniref:Uncharacterized protein n=1 Tax=Paxillus rubicundulus Ve08.2h10 TaxID=930991 RepID=A0A0D0CNS7_9AGAM|nr:hypothetical protein PAXRUDRAFT_22020 [Paxillus rubicundulus Ve08.2h10]